MENILVKNPVKEILELCKHNTKTEKINIKDLCRTDYKDNKVILDKYFKNERGEDCFYANLLYFRQFENVSLNDIKNALKSDFKKAISLAGYKYNPEHYKFVTQALQDEYEEDLFKCKSREEEELEKYEEYKYKQIEGIDFEAVDKLTKVLFNALRKRWVMIFHLENIPGLINNALECHYLGVSCKPSNNAMNAKIAEIRALLDNKDVIEWLKTNPTDLMFDRCDYVSTYQRVLRNLTCIDNELSYVREIIHNPEDIFEEEILSNEFINTTCYIENTETNEEEE